MLKREGRPESSVPKTQRAALRRPAEEIASGSFEPIGFVSVALRAHARGETYALGNLAQCAFVATRTRARGDDIFRIYIRKGIHTRPRARGYSDGIF
jgi:hypothetical protein